MTPLLVLFGCVWEEEEVGAVGGFLEELCELQPNITFNEVGWLFFFVFFYFFYFFSFFFFNPRWSQWINRPP